MNNLFNLAKSGLNVGQSALNVVGSNMINATSQNYSRREMIIGESGGLATAQGFYGYGARVNNISRVYDAFTNTQLRDSGSKLGALDGRYQQLADIDNMLGDVSDNVSVSLNNLFKSMATLSGDASDGPARAAVYSSLGVLTQRFNESGKRLDNLEKSTNSQIDLSVKDINAYTQQLAEINKQLERVQAQNGSAPADLLDQRDALLESLALQVGIDVTENKITGRVDVTLADGRPLVFGEEQYKLATSPSPSDPNKTIVSYVNKEGKSEAINESSFTKGRLSGLFKFRNEDLELARNELDQIAFQMASRFNEQHRQGYTPAGDAGGDLFKLPDMQVFANTKNTGTGNLTNGKVTDYTKVNAEDYSISFDGSQWTVKGADGRTVPATLSGDTLAFDGVEIDVPAGAASGDSFTLNPVAGAATGISRALASAQDFAASDKVDGGPSNNNNLEKMLKIQDEKLIGKSTLSEAYSSLVGTIGSNARAVQSNMTSAQIDADTKLETKQAFSGVDLNEENVNMTMFLQYYQASAQMLQTATSLLDTLLAIK
ncbi:MAG TPA: flagellar hook-associated protein FlgK [Pantoea sp.]|nr:flagellar hook-associated protein FlgK [Pantoea sp.]